MQELQEADHQTNAGFSLVEVLVAIAILAVVTLGIVAVIPSGYTQITDAGRLSVMNHIGQKKLDELRGLHWSHADLTVGTHPASPEWPLGTDQRYTIQWTVDDCPTAVDCPSTTGTGDAKLIRVTVGYDTHKSDGTPISPDESRGQETYVFKTVVAK